MNEKYELTTTEKIIKVISGIPGIKQVVISVILATALANQSCKIIPKEEEVKIKVEAEPTNILPFGNNTAAPDATAEPVETLTEEPTATPEPEPQIANTDLSEIIQSEVPDNVHIDEVNKTVTIDYEDEKGIVGSIIYKDAEYIGVSYSKQYFEVEEGSIALIYEDPTLENVKFSNGVYEIEYYYEGKSYIYPLDESEADVRIKTRYFLKSGNQTLIESNYMSLIQLENGKRVINYNRDREYTNDVIRKYNFAATYGDATILFDAKDIAAVDIPISIESMFLYNSKIELEQYQRTLADYQEYFFNPTQDDSGVMSLNRNFLELYGKKSSAYGGSYITKEKYSDIEGGFERSVYTRFIIGIYDKYPGLTENDIYDFLELEGLKQDIYIACVNEDQEAEAKALEAYLTALSSPDQKAINVYFSTLNSSLTLVNYSDFHEFDMYGETNSMVDIVEYINDMTQYLTDYHMYTVGSNKMSKTMGDIENTFKEAKMPKLEKYLTINTDTKNTTDENTNTTSISTKEVYEIPTVQFLSTPTINTSSNIYYSAFGSTTEEADLAPYNTGYAGYIFEDSMEEQAKVKEMIKEENRRYKFRTQTGAKNIYEEMEKEAELKKAI